MSTNVGAVDFELLLNSNPFNKGIKTAGDTVKKSGIDNSLKKIGKLAMTAFSVKAVVNFTKECLELGSNLAEVQNVVDVTFGNLSGEVDAFAKNAIDQFGLGQTVAKQYMGTFGAMAKSFNFNNQAALEMSKSLTGLVGDVASFYNLSSDAAYTKLKSVFTGETEALKDLGVVMTQNALDQYAMSKGFGKTTAKMTEQEKTALRYQFVLDKLSIAQGDFARTSDGWANQTRVLGLRFNELKASLGQGFINLFTPIVKGINWVLSKLQVLADTFKSFTEFITGHKNDTNGLGSVAADVSDISSSADNASDAVAGIGNSAAKASKKMKQLASFDTAQVLKSDKDESRGAGGSSIGTVGLDFGNSLASTMAKADKQMDASLSKLKEIASIFKEGFNASLGDITFDIIFKHLNGIKNSLISIFTDKRVIESANSFADKFAYSLGQVIGALGRIGKNAIELLVGSVDNYLSQNNNRLKKHLTSIFSVSGKDIELTGKLWQALGEISDAFKSDTAKQIGANIITMFANPFMSAIEVVSKFAVDLKAMLVQPIIANAEKIKTTIENVMKPIETFTGTLASAMTYVGDKWNEVYDQHIHPLMEALKTGISDTFGKFLDAYNTYVAPMLQRLADKFNELWNTHLRPFVDNVAGLIGSIADAVMALWNNILKPVIDWIIQNILPVLVPIFESLWNTICNIFGAIADTIGGIIQTFKGLIDFVIGVFTGDWNKAWEGIKTFFTGIWQAVSGYFKAVWETIKGVVQIGIDFVKGIITVGFNAIKTVIYNIWNDVSNTISNVWDTITAKIREGVSGAWNAITSVFGNIANWFREKFSQAWEAVKNVFSKGRTNI